MDNSLYKSVETFAASNELMNRSSKTQSLNILRQKLIDSREKTTDRIIRGMIDYDLAIIEDCFEIDVYKFQFKGLMDILQKDINNIEKALIL